MPDHDLHVTLRVLPCLVKYQGSRRHGLLSRSWGSAHDGESFKIEKVEKVEKGSVARSGRKVGSQNWIRLASNVVKQASGNSQHKISPGSVFKASFSSSESLVAG